MSTSSLTSLLDTLPPPLPAQRQERGSQFEKICRWYLENDPVYRSQLTNVWLWKEWPGRWGEEAGIDLVAETRDGHLWAIQAKAWSPAYSIKKDDIDSFLSESARPEFSYRLLVATTNKIGRLAERTMRAQEKPVGQVLLYDLLRADVDWPTSIDDLRPSRPVPSRIMHCDNFAATPAGQTFPIETAQFASR